MPYPVFDKINLLSCAGRSKCLSLTGRAELSLRRKRSVTRLNGESLLALVTMISVGKQFLSQYTMLPRRLTGYARSSWHRVVQLFKSKSHGASR